MLVDGITDGLKMGEIGLKFMNTKFPNFTEDSRILLHLIVSVTTSVFINQEHVVDPQVQLAYYSANFDNMLENFNQH